MHDDVTVSVPSAAEAEDVRRNSDNSSSEQDTVPPMLSMRNKPHFSSRYNRRQTLDIFIPQLDVPMLLTQRHVQSKAAYNNTSRGLSILAATQDLYQHLAADLRRPERRDLVRSIMGSPVSVIENTIVPEIRNVQVLNLGKSPVQIVPGPTAQVETRPKSFFDVMDEQGTFLFYIFIFLLFSLCNTIWYDQCLGVIA
jgi:hypothetical protein